MVLVEIFNNFMYILSLLIIMIKNYIIIIFLILYYLLFLIFYLKLNKIFYNLNFYNYKNLKVNDNNFVFFILNNDYDTYLNYKNKKQKIKKFFVFDKRDNLLGRHLLNIFWNIEVHFEYWVTHTSNIKNCRDLKFFKINILKNSISNFLKDLLKNKKNFKNFFFNFYQNDSFFIIFHWLLFCDLYKNHNLNLYIFFRFINKSVDLTCYRLDKLFYNNLILSFNNSYNLIDIKNFSEIWYHYKLRETLLFSIFDKKFFPFFFLYLKKKQLFDFIRFNYYYNVHEDFFCNKFQSYNSLEVKIYKSSPNIKFLNNRFPFARLKNDLKFSYIFYKKCN